MIRLLVLLFLFSFSFSSCASRQKNILPFGQNTEKRRVTELLDAAFNAFIEERYEEAIVNFQIVLQTERDDPTALKGLKQAEKKLKKRNEYLKKRSREAKSMAHNGKWLDAADELHEILSNFSNQAEALQVKHDLEQLLNKKIVSVSYESEKYSLLQGVLYYYQKRYQDSIRLWKEASLLYPQNLELGVNLKRAESKILLRDEKTLYLLKSRARSAFENENYDEAVKIWEEYLSHSPENKEAQAEYLRAQKMSKKTNKKFFIGDYYDEGLSLFQQRKYTASCRQWREIITLEPDNAVARDYIQQIRRKGVKCSTQPLDEGLVVNGRQDGASKGAFDQSEELVETGKFGQGVTLYKNGNYQDSIAYFKKYLRKNPKDQYAIKWHKKIKKEQGENAQAFYEKGIISFMAGNVSEAVEKWKAALQIMPSHESSKRALDKAKDQENAE